LALGRGPVRGPSHRCKQFNQGYRRHGSVVSVQVVRTMRGAVVLIIRRSWVRAPPAPPGFICVNVEMSRLARVAASRYVLDNVREPTDASIVRPRSPTFWAIDLRSALTFGFRSSRGRGAKPTLSRQRCRTSPGESRIALAPAPDAPVPDGEPPPSGGASPGAPADFRSAALPGRSGLLGAGLGEGAAGPRWVRVPSWSRMHRIYVASSRTPNAGGSIVENSAASPARTRMVRSPSRSTMVPDRTVRTSRTVWLARKPAR
jgi:hypothetical protein